MRSTLSKSEINRSRLLSPSSDSSDKVILRKSVCSVSVIFWVNTDQRAHPEHPG